MKILLYVVVLLSSQAVAQTAPYLEKLNARSVPFTFEGDSIQLLLVSKQGEERIVKPLFLFCQGSQPKPLIVYNERGSFPLFPFNDSTFSDKYHLVIIGKPNVPLAKSAKELNKSYNWVDKNGRPFADYSAKNNLAYYVRRNAAVLSYLQKQAYVLPKPLVVAGHSEGATIAAEMATQIAGITHLIYASGNPLGRILNIIADGRAGDVDTVGQSEENFDYWKYIVDNANVDTGQGDTPKTTYGFSQPQVENLLRLKIPVLVSYGTKDVATPYIDYLRVTSIQRNNRYVAFKAYLGLEHNFFPMDATGKPDYQQYNWPKVAQDWRKWLDSK